jgi:hypothetical protein
MYYGVHSVQVATHRFYAIGSSIIEKGSRLE